MFSEPFITWKKKDATHFWAAELRKISNSVKNRKIHFRKDSKQN